MKFEKVNKKGLWWELGERIATKPVLVLDDILEERRRVCPNFVCQDVSAIK